MALTKIEAEIEIPEGFEFDRIDIPGEEENYILVSSRVILRKKPKPAKPAYRCYLERNHDAPLTVTRATYNKYHDAYDGKVEWISDWIEYDQPKKWPTPLVERIAAVDLEAAEWIVEHWDDLQDEKYKVGRYERENDRLSDMFYWSSSPQLREYWDKISDQLGEGL